MKKKSACKNISEEANLPLSEKPSKYRSSYGQISYLMKRLNVTLSGKLNDGRPCKCCKCGLKLRLSRIKKNDQHAAKKQCNQATQCKIKPTVKKDNPPE